MLTKEKYEKALEVLECKAYDGCDKCYSQDEELCKKCEDKYFVEVDIIKQLIREHFELVEEYKKLETSDASKEECTIEQYCEIKQLRSELKQLQDEVDKYKHEYYSMCDLFENPQPYKFEDLKPNMWFWDDYSLSCAQITKVLTDKMLVVDEFRVRFKENRFYPVTKALQYQGEYKGNGK